MAAMDNFVLGQDGYYHSDCLHWEGFTTLLWDVLSHVGYTTPPSYAIREFAECGLLHCGVRVTVAPHPAHPDWAPLDTEMVCHRVADAVATAALSVMNTFCRHHPLEIMHHPVGLLPTGQPDDLEWLDRIANMNVTAILGGTLETVAQQSRYVSALYGLQAFKDSALRTVTLRTEVAHDYIERLKDANSALTFELTDMDNMKVQMQVQVAGLQAQVEGFQAQVATLQEERNAHVAALAAMEGEIHDVRLELDEVNELIEMHLHHDHGDEAMDVDEEKPMEVEFEPEEIEIEPEEIEGMSELDEMSEAPLSTTRPTTPTESVASVNDLDDF